MLRLLFTAVLLLVFSSGAEARYHHHHTAPGLHPQCNVTMPCEAPYASSVRETRDTRGRYIANEMGFGGPRHHAAPISFNSIPRPLRYISGRLVCAVNVNAALAERGIRGTGSALARSFDHWGIRVATPVPGAVAVSDRRGGGHVAIVSRVEGGHVYVWNATGRHHGWTERDYTNRHARYRVAAF